MANLVVCSDGTWNTPDDMEAGVPAPTNVVKVHAAVAATDANGVEQKKYYHPGVGTDGGWWNKLAGGGAGDGLDRNIKSAYHWLARNYRPGDQIYLFGFSRGAYTARSLGGMITCCGLLDLSDPQLPPDEVWARVDAAFACYRDGSASDAIKAFQIFNRPNAPADPKDTTPIHFVGVWDTVGALGIPDDMALLNLLDNVEDHSFHNTRLSTSVKHARHAVAMDEHRQTFTPTFWTGVENRPSVKQVWFPGVHSDVGGGYAAMGLADGALQWMMTEAEGAGLSFRQGAAQQVKPDPRGMLHDSVTSVFKVLKTSPRCVPNLADAAMAPHFHASALDRFNNPPLQQADYWTTSALSVGASRTLDIFAREQWNRTGLYLAGGAEYQFVARGQWRDASIKCGPGGTDDGKFGIGEVAQMAGSTLGFAETLWRKATGNMHADFWWTKRVEEMPWFALVGVIADGIGTDDSGNPIPHTTFLIGDSRRLKIDAGQGGYLYAFANDAWQAYLNNTGSVSLTVKRLS